MKLHFSKDWLRKKVEENDWEEPGGVMACSPFLYAWMTTEGYAHDNDVVAYILELSLTEATRDRQHLGDSDDRFIWMMHRAKRFAARMSRKNQQVSTNC